MKHNEREGITSYIAGGLGNQLFMLAAAWEQSNRLDVPLFLNTSYNRATGGRPNELNGLAHPGTDLESHGTWTSLKYGGYRAVPIPKTPRAIMQRIFLERDVAQYDPRIAQVKPGTFLVGYFQSPKYFPSVAPQMQNLFDAAPSTQDEKEYFAELKANPAITLHLRRGDYHAFGDKSVIASVDYAARAIDLLRTTGLDFPVRVFSDSPELVEKELSSYTDFKFELADEGRLKSGINVIKAMSLGSGLVMSNSSFSWWAGWLMRRDAGAPVVCPRPWDTGGSARADLLYPDWPSLDAR